MDTVCQQTSQYSARDEEGEEREKAYGASPEPPPGFKKRPVERDAAKRKKLREMQEAEEGVARATSPAPTCDDFSESDDEDVLVSSLAMHTAVAATVEDEGCGMEPDDVEDEEEGEAEDEEMELDDVEDKEAE